MKDSGPVMVGSPEGNALIEYARTLAQRLDMTPAAALGQVLKFDDAIREAAKSNIGMARLKIKVEEKS